MDFIEPWWTPGPISWEDIALSVPLVVLEAALVVPFVVALPLAAAVGEDGSELSEEEIS